MRLSCYKTPGEIWVKIVESTLIDIGLVRLSLWNNPNLAMGQTNKSYKQVPSTF